MIYEQIISKTPIEKGWSVDQKYRAADAHGGCYLLRVSPAEMLKKRELQFHRMERAFQTGVAMCAPLEFGACPEGAYSIQSWVDGEDAEERICGLPARAQYETGLEAGRILKAIHGIPAPAGQEDWFARFNRKIDRNLRALGDCPVKCPNGPAFASYVDGNRELLKDRPQCYQHGDYHIGNLMIDRGGRLTVIDFDRDDYGDPWEEFNRIVWCARKVPFFAAGRIDGYFEGFVPEAFWRLLALYIFNNALSSVPWALPFGQGEVEVMIGLAREVYAWYGGMTRLVPLWYQKP